MIRSLSEIDFYLLLEHYNSLRGNHFLRYYYVNVNFTILRELLSNWKFKLRILNKWRNKNEKNLFNETFGDT